MQNGQISGCVATRVDALQPTASECRDKWTKTNSLCLSFCPVSFFFFHYAKSFPLIRRLLFQSLPTSSSSCLRLPFFRQSRINGTSPVPSPHGENQHTNTHTHTHTHTQAHINRNTIKHADTGCKKCSIKKKQKKPTQPPGDPSLNKRKCYFVWNHRPNQNLTVITHIGQKDSQCVLCSKMCVWASMCVDMCVCVWLNPSPVESLWTVEVAPWLLIFSVEK